VPARIERDGASSYAQIGAARPVSVPRADGAPRRSKCTLTPILSRSTERGGRTFHVAVLYARRVTPLAVTAAPPASPPPTAQTPQPISAALGAVRNLRPARRHASKANDMFPSRTVAAGHYPAATRRTRSRGGCGRRVGRGAGADVVAPPARNSSGNGPRRPSHVTSCPAAAPPGAAHGRSVRSR
jgi:hypothetical protein